MTMHKSQSANEMRHNAQAIPGSTLMESGAAFWQSFAREILSFSHHFSRIKTSLKCFSS